MLVKGIIKSYVNENNLIKIRIPKYHKFENVAGCTPDDNLPYAAICSLPGITPVYIPEDIVYIEFEDDDLSKPVIIGKLIRNNDINSYSNISAQSLSINGDAKISSDTQIGSITYENLKYVTESFINQTAT